MECGGSVVAREPVWLAAAWGVTRIGVCVR